QRNQYQDASNYNSSNGNGMHVSHGSKMKRKTACSTPLADVVSHFLPTASCLVFSFSSLGRLRFLSLLSTTAILLTCFMRTTDATRVDFQKLSGETILSIDSTSADFPWNKDLQTLEDVVKQANPSLFHSEHQKPEFFYKNQKLNKSLITVGEFVSFVEQEEDENREKRDHDYTGKVDKHHRDSTITAVIAVYKQLRTFADFLMLVEQDPEKELFANVTRDLMRLPFEQLGMENDDADDDEEVFTLTPRKNAPMFLQRVWQLRKNHAALMSSGSATSSPSSTSGGIKPTSPSSPTKSKRKRSFSVARKKFQNAEEFADQLDRDFLTPSHQQRLYSCASRAVVPSLVDHACGPEVHHLPAPPVIQRYFAAKA
ncbi:unnamed protein product, partial [Amoebophrya sp. A120]